MGFSSFSTLKSDISVHMTKFLRHVISPGVGMGVGTRDVRTKMIKSSWGWVPGSLGSASTLSVWRLVLLILYLRGTLLPCRSRRHSSVDLGEFPSRSLSSDSALLILRLLWVMTELNTPVTYLGEVLLYHVGIPSSEIWVHCLTWQSLYQNLLIESSQCYLVGD